MSTRAGYQLSVLLMSAALIAGCGASGGDGSRVAALWRALAARVGLAPPDAEPSPRPPTPAGDAGQDGVIDAVARALDAEQDEADSGPGYWRYTESNGSLRFVQSLAEVPESARASAERIATAAPRAAAARPAPVPAAPPTRPVQPSEPARRADPAVVVYTTSWCGWCRKTLAWLDERGVDYENRDIERNPEWAAELERKTGRQSIPVVDVDGRIVRGFDPGTLEELL